MLQPLTEMRIDKFLKVSRILKRRATACDAANNGRIKVNGLIAKPSKKIKVKDIIEIGFNSETVKFEILALKETVKKEEADSLYHILED